MAPLLVVLWGTRCCVERLTDVRTSCCRVRFAQLFVSLTLVLTIYGSSVALSLLPSRNAHGAHAHAPPSPYGLGPAHFQHLGPVPPAYYALPPQGYPQGHAQGGGWAVGPPAAGAGGSPGLGAKGEGKKGWF